MIALAFSIEAVFRWVTGRKINLPKSLMGDKN